MAAELMARYGTGRKSIQPTRPTPSPSPHSVFEEDSENALWFDLDGNTTTTPMDRTTARALKPPRVTPSTPLGVLTQNRLVLNAHTPPALAGLPGRGGAESAPVSARSRGTVTSSMSRQSVRVQQPPQAMDDNDFESVLRGLRQLRIGMLPGASKRKRRSHRKRSLSRAQSEGAIDESLLSAGDSVSSGVDGGDDDARTVASTRTTMTTRSRAKVLTNKKSMRVNEDEEGRALAKANLTLRVLSRLGVDVASIARTTVCSEKIINLYLFTFMRHTPASAQTIAGNMPPDHSLAYTHYDTLLGAKGRHFRLPKEMFIRYVRLFEAKHGRIEEIPLVVPDHRHAPAPSTNLAFKTAVFEDQPCVVAINKWLELVHGVYGMDPAACLQWFYNVFRRVRFNALRIPS